MKKQCSIVLICLLFSPVLAIAQDEGCTNLLVTKGASTTGSVMICYTCDAGFVSHLQYIPGRIALSLRVFCRSGYCDNLPPAQLDSAQYDEVRSCGLMR